ncbi:MAG: ribonuclease HII [Gemmatimonadota bacterium]|nr:MAG: ribonuclease HII [Gemmatimonadota bacterium]
MLFERELWNMGHSYVAGIDEAGRGPLAGPVVAAAVIFPQDAYISGVDDSKKISAKKREHLYSEIMSLSCSVGVGLVSEKEIDRTNIVRATFQAMHKALETLSIRPHYVLIDGFELPECPCCQKAIIGGDGHSFCIAAASIVAKVTRDRIMIDYDHRFPEYGFAKHKGYATRGHRAALGKYGPCEIHRRSFSWKRNV